VREKKGDGVISTCELATNSLTKDFVDGDVQLFDSSTAQTHEWDVYRQGVFSYEVLSGLRGAADVNRDGRIEYSELYAFLGAANREVADERARLSVVARPPTVNRRAPIVDLHALRDAGRVVGNAGALGWFVIEDDRGNRLADVRAAHGAEVSLTVPADRDLFLRSRDEEAQLRVARGGVVELASLQMRPLATNARGAIESALARGLFAATFGPEYYRGFVDGKSELVPVPINEPRLVLAKPPRPSHRAAWATFGVAGALGAASIVFAALAGQALSDFNATSIEKRATDAQNRFNIFEPVAITTAVLSAGGAIVGAWLWIRTSRSTAIAPRVNASTDGAVGGVVIRF
jgi:hypothetical protein